MNINTNQANSTIETNIILNLLLLHQKPHPLEFVIEVPAPTERKAIHSMEAEEEKSTQQKGGTYCKFRI